MYIYINIYVYISSAPLRAEEKTSVFSTLLACHSEEGGEGYLGFFHSSSLFLLFVFHFAGFILHTVLKKGKFFYSSFLL